MKWIVILAVLLSMHSKAQKQSLCYEISNEELGIERSYLFGTMHAMEENSFFFPKRITKLLEKSDALCLEIKNIMPWLAIYVINHSVLANRFFCLAFVQLARYFGEVQQTDVVHTFLYEGALNC